MGYRKNTRFLHLILICTTIISIIYTRVAGGNNLSLDSVADSESFSTLLSLPDSSSNEDSNNGGAGITIAIATAVCSEEAESEQAKQAAVMIKSAIISAHLYNVSQIHFYVFLEHPFDSYYFTEKIEEFGRPFKSLHVELHLRDVLDISLGNTNPIDSSNQSRCDFIKIYLPNALSDLDAVIYLDTDVIVTGSILDLWSYFDRMKYEQFIASTLDNQHGIVMHTHSGVLLMNLSQTRQYNFEDKMKKLQKEYQNLSHLSFDKLLENLLYFDEGIILNLPCQFNFRKGYCEGITCYRADEDPKGIQLIHGASDFKYLSTLRPIYYAHINEINSLMHSHIRQYEICNLHSILSNVTILM